MTQTCFAAALVIEFDAASFVERLKRAISGEEPLDELGTMAVVAKNLEELERRIVAVESRE